MEGESPLTYINFTCTKDVRCSACIFITQETVGLVSDFPSLSVFLDMIEPPSPFTLDF